MEFNIISEKFKKFISFATYLCESNFTLPILNNILLILKKDNLEIISTNLENILIFSFNIKTEEKGKILIPGRIFSNYISYLPKGEIKIKEENLIINIECENYKAKIFGQNPEEFPILPQIKKEKPIEISSNELISALNKVIHMVSSSDSRVEISGILLRFDKKRLKVCGTDSIRLSEKILPLKEISEEIKTKSVIIPQKTASLLCYIFSNLDGKIEIVIESAQIIFYFTPNNSDDPKITLISKLIEGEYPEYEDIIPKEVKTQAILNKEEFQNKIKVASLFSSRIQDIKLSFNPEKKNIEIIATSTEKGEQNSIIKGEIEGKPIEVVFNWKYLLDGLSVIDSSEIFFGLNDPNSQTIFRPVGDKTYLYILMPKTI